MIAQFSCSVGASRRLARIACNAETPAGTTLDDQPPGATMATDDLTCRELVELVTDYLEGALSTVERERFEWHLRRCAVCPGYVDQLRTTIQALGRLRVEDVPDAAREPLLAAFRTWKIA
jgi:hypothetical protein